MTCLSLAIYVAKQEHAENDSNLYSLVHAQVRSKFRVLPYPIEEILD